MQPVIYADLRCLQDANYRIRGIGQHLAALLRTRTQSNASKWKMIGLTDPRCPKLPDEYASLIDEVHSSLNPCYNGTRAIFIDGTPMTHDTRFDIRFQNRSAFLRAAVVYDFIPLDWPGYLPTVASRIDYFAKIARLRNFDLFLPISEYVARRVTEILGISRDRISVTGASVRGSLYALRDRTGIIASDNHRNEPYFLMMSSDDKRKNAEVAVKAVRRLNEVYGQRIPLKIVGHYEGAHKVLGHYGDDYRQFLLQLAGHPAGEEFLEFWPNVSDEELACMHARATAAIAPYHIEGFSLPVVEASVCRCPVVASDCAAHLELVEQAEALFPAADSGVLYEKLDALLNQPALRDFLVASQAHLGAKFHEAEVGRRFWSAVEGAEGDRQAPVWIKRKKPRLAFLSPYPPDESGVARYTARTLQAAESLFHSDLYTDAVRPLAFEGGRRDAGKVNIAPLVGGTYDAIISVLGNSHFHSRIFDVFERYGGPCILHDARLIQIYAHRLGQERFLKMVARLLGRVVTMEEVHAWLQDPNPPSLLLEPVIERASPLIVHTKTQQAEIKRRYGVDAHVNVCCSNYSFEAEELTTSKKEAARKRLNIPAGVFLISSFGIVAPEKGMETCILALELLRSWNIPAELYFVGPSDLHPVDAFSARYGVARHVHSYRMFVHEATYRDFLIASDAALQLRTYGFGQLSAALTDCIGAGLPSVANSDLAESCDAPEYVSIVPDVFSPLQVAEKLALIWETKNGCAARAEARAAYVETHNFEYYGKRLLEILGIS